MSQIPWPQGFSFGMCRVSSRFLSRTTSSSSCFFSRPKTWRDNKNEANCSQTWIPPYAEKAMFTGELWINQRWLALSREWGNEINEAIYGYDGNETSLIHFLVPAFFGVIGNFPWYFKSATWGPKFARLVLKNPSTRYTRRPSYLQPQGETPTISELPCRGKHLSLSSLMYDCNPSGVWDNLSSTLLHARPSGKEAYIYIYDYMMIWLYIYILCVCVCVLWKSPKKNIQNIITSITSIIWATLKV